MTEKRYKKRKKGKDKGICEGEMEIRNRVA